MTTCFLVSNNSTIKQCHVPTLSPASLVVDASLQVRATLVRGALFLRGRQQATLRHWLGVPLFYILRQCGNLGLFEITHYGKMFKRSLIYGVPSKITDNYSSPNLSKAFDTIDHSTLLVKLEGCGVRGVANNLIKSYLTNRKQYTEVVGEKSDTLSIQFGVPQGSILGPLLFLLYMNDITNSSKLGSFVTFADDTNIFVVGKTKLEAYERGNKLLSPLQSYMRANKLHNKHVQVLLHTLQAHHGRF